MSVEHKKWANREVKYRYLVSNIHNIAFYYIPKSSCTTIGTILRLAQTKEEQKKSYARSTINSNFRLVAIVRNPYERYVSYMCNKHSNIEIHFDNHVKNKNKKNINVHLALQTDLIDIEKKSDYIKIRK